MSTDFNQTVDAFEAQASRMEAPRQVLARLCHVAAELVEAVCILKLGPDAARGWIANCREDLAAEALEAFVLADDEVPALRVVRQTRIPMSMTNLETPALRAFLAARGHLPPRPCTIFPLSIGDKLPFIVYVDREQPLTAPEIGQLTRLLMAASVQFARLIAGKRRQPPRQAVAQDGPSHITRLMVVNWVSEYRGSTASKPSDTDEER